MTNKWWQARGYKTKKALEDEIRGIINGITVNSKITDTASKELLIWVLSHHHEYYQKTQDSNDFDLQVRRSQFNSKHKELWIVFNEKYQPIDISWTAALKKDGKSTVKENLSEAARQAINDQIFAFKERNNDFECCLCGEAIDENLEVCHYEPRFDDLLKGYFGSDESKYNEFKILDGVYAERIFENDVQKNGWAEYHAKNAVLKAVHSNCRSQRSRS